MRAPVMPPANASTEAVALRKAAIAFVENMGVEPRDIHDSVGAKLNRELCKAACAYAARASAEEVRQ